MNEAVSPGMVYRSYTVKNRKVDLVFIVWKTQNLDKNFVEFEEQKPNLIANIKLNCLQDKESITIQGCLKQVYSVIMWSLRI